jgi:uncharacterized membrane protein
MNKIEFVEQMRRSLSSIDDYTYVNDTIAYYENYIESQIRMGKSEEQVMQELGDPRLIAKSICASHMTEGEEQGNAYTNRESSFGQKAANTVINLNGKLINMPSWLLKILSVLAAVVILVLLFTVLRILSPFLIVGFLGYMIYRLITGNGR